MVTVHVSALEGEALFWKVRVSTSFNVLPQAPSLAVLGPTETAILGTVSVDGAPVAVTVGVAANAT